MDFLEESLYLTEWEPFDILSALVFNLPDDEYTSLYNHFADWACDVEKITCKKDMNCKHNALILFLMIIETDETIDFFRRHKDKFSWDDWEG